MHRIFIDTVQQVPVFIQAAVPAPCAIKLNASSPKSTPNWSISMFAARICSWMSNPNVSRSARAFCVMPSILDGSISWVVLRHRCHRVRNIFQAFPKIIVIDTQHRVLKPLRRFPCYTSCRLEVVACLFDIVGKIDRVSGRRH